MTTIYSSSAALSALREVNSINRELAASAERIASGRRISTAKDGAAIWAIARSLEGDISLAGTMSDQLAVVEATFGAAATGLSTAATALGDLRDQLVLARAGGADRASIQTQIDGLQYALQSAATGAKVGNVEILSQSASGSYNPVKTFTIDVVRGGSGTSVSDFDFDVRGVALVNANADEGILDASRTVNATTSTVLTLDVSALTDAAGDIQIIDDFISMVDAALTEIASAETLVGSAISRVQSQASLLDTMTAARQQALSTLVDANLEEEAAQKDALVVRQQLAIEALSIANTNLATILRLFE